MRLGNESSLYICFFSLEDKNYFEIIVLTIFVIIILFFLLNNHSAIYPIQNINKINFKYFHYFILLAIICGFLSFLLLNICRYYYKKIILIKNYKWHFIPIILGFIVALIGINLGIYSVGGGIRTTNQVIADIKKNARTLILTAMKIRTTILNAMRQIAKMPAHLMSNC